MNGSFTSNRHCPGMVIYDHYICVTANIDRIMSIICYQFTFHLGRYEIH